MEILGKPWGGRDEDQRSMTPEEIMLFFFCIRKRTMPDHTQKMQLEITNSKKKGTRVPKAGERERES